MILEQYSRYALEHKIFLLEYQSGKNNLIETVYNQETLENIEKTTDYYKYLGREIILEGAEKSWDQSKGTHASMSLTTCVHFGLEVGIDAGNQDIFQHFYHKHQFLELVYVYQGQYRHIIDGKEEILKQGELCLINPNCIHYDPLEVGAQIIYIGMPLHLLGTDPYLLNEMGEILRCFVENCREKEAEKNEHICFYQRTGEETDFLENFEAIAKEHFEKKIGSSYMMLALVLRVLELAFENCDVEYISQTSKRVEKKLFHQIDEYCKSHLCSVSKQEIQNKFYFTGTQIDTIVKKAVGTTFVKYLIQIRMEKAKSLILQESGSIDQVMEQVGYSNRTYFYKKFTQRYGINPGELKKVKKGYKN